MGKKPTKSYYCATSTPLGLSLLFVVFELFYNLVRYRKVTVMQIILAHRNASELEECS